MLPALAPCALTEQARELARVAVHTAWLQTLRRGLLDRCAPEQKQFSCEASKTGNLEIGDSKPFSIISHPPSALGDC